ncbi:hypothetical protein IPA_00885 [Ignicoccus pacificus DSM 13166]|uniref:Uncharacterized protein n=1 Tax=Ignicoccus pacificus DSM 13166 TaxID=940294 RepID=A0A977KAE1_9CREN|nr:hypothetical protein IPA_00885 [Ignicoccus pacificus DSM 13166]
MPKFVERNKHILLLGPGIDYLLDPERRIILIDDYFSDVYSDIVFQGYETFVSPVEPTKPDFIGAYMVAMLLSAGPSILVCGFKPDFCLLAYPAYLILFENMSTQEALEETKELLGKIYEKVEVPYQIELGLKTLERLNKLLGFEQLNVVLAAAQNYDFGKDRFRYSDRLAWLTELGAENKYILASTFYFLVEGHGKPHELFKLRTEALGKENIVKVIGEEALKVLEDIANGKTPKIMEFVEALEPGDVGIQYVKREGEVLKTKCLVGPACVSAIEKAKKLLPVETPSGPVTQVSPF